MVDNNKKSFGTQVCDYGISLIFITIFVYAFVTTFVDIFIHNKIPQQVCCCEMEKINRFYNGSYDDEMNRVVRSHNPERMPFCVHFINDTKKVQYQESNIMPNTELVDEDGNIYYLPESEKYNGLIELNRVVRNVTIKYNLHKYEQTRSLYITRTLRKYFFPLNYCALISNDGMLSLSYIKTKCNVFTQDLD